MFLYIIVIVIITDTEDCMSRQREAVLAAVRGRRLHPDAETVFRCVRESMPDISLGTVYRNLGRLADEGLIRRVPVPFGADRFDGTLTVHGHIICSRCGAVCDIPEDITRELAQRLGDGVTSIELTASRICPECKENKIL